MLRQDPDVVMVGEIRDKQTAHVAIEAALTGHLVMSTLHTNDAPATIMRLMDMAIEPFLINASITGVLAQRLARKICTACRISCAPTLAERALLKRLGLHFDVLYKGVGCSACFNLGYKGRIGIFELLVSTSALRLQIVQQPMFEAIYAQAISDGMQTLLADGARKVADGIISLHELARVLL
jgi:type II secretory ATPase GspE/PulE/Tfp pilus assembly ATPase PilB-like protein